MEKITLRLILLVVHCICFQIPLIFAQKGFSPSTDPNSDTRNITQLIFSVDPKYNGINDVFLKEPDKEAQLYRLKGECYRCEFYTGTIEGSFTVRDSRIKPGKKATLTIYTMDNLIPGKIFDPGNFPPGSRFTVSRTKATVIENQKGNFKVRTH